MTILAAVTGTSTASAASDSRTSAAECLPTADYGWLCAYQYPNRGGENIGMHACGVYYIPWVTVGSLDNNLPPGTPVVVTFTNGSTWVMPPSPSYTPTGVNWAPVRSIRIC